MHEIKKIINEIEQRGYEVKNFSNISFGINSSTFKIESYEAKYLLKIYNSSKINPIDRLKHESKFLTFLKSQFQARSTIPRQGSDPDAVLSRSEAFLKTNDLEKSLFELTQLDGIALKVMEPWRISAENRINSLLAVEQLVQSIEK